MVYSVNLTRCFEGDINSYQLAICSTPEKAVEIRRQAIIAFTKGDMFDGCTFDKSGNLLTEAENSRYKIEVGCPIGSDVDNFAVWVIMDNTNFDWLDVFIRPMEIDKGLCL